jgi:MFS family permease
MFMDRLGPRRVGFAGVILYCIGMIFVGLSGPEIWKWYLAWCWVALWYAMVGSAVWTTLVSRTFRRQRGLALSASLVGTGMANFVIPSVAVYIFHDFGWRMVFFALASIGFVICLPIIWILLSRPAKPSLNTALIATATLEAGVLEMSATEIFQSRKFWQLALAILLMGPAIGALTAHVQPILRDAGVSASAAASYAALIGPTLLFGRLFSGFLLDHLPVRLMAASAFILPAIPCMMFIHYHGSVVTAVMAISIFGLSYGAETDVVAYLVSRYFGLIRYPLAFSVLISIFGLGFGIGTVGAGAMHDALGSYDAMLMLLIACLFISGILTASLGSAPEIESVPQSAPPLEVMARGDVIP